MQYISTHVLQPRPYLSQCMILVTFVQSWGHTGSMLFQWYPILATADEWRLELGIWIPA